MSMTHKVEGALFVNGQERPLPPGGDLPSLLRELGVQAEEQGVAVALNGEVVLRREWGGMRLAPGDQVEIVRAVQGG